MFQPIVAAIMTTAVQCLGKRRAEQLALLLQGANLKSPSYKVTWRDESAQATGVDDYAIRRAVITVRAGGAGR